MAADGRAENRASAASSVALPQLATVSLAQRHGAAVVSRSVMIAHGPSSRRKRPSVGDILRASGVVTDEQLELAARHADACGGRIGSALIELGHLDADRLAEVLARQHGVAPCLEVDFATRTRAAAALIPSSVARELCALPLRVVGGTMLVVAMRDPDEATVAALRRWTKLHIQPRSASEQRIRRALDDTDLAAPVAEPAPPLPPALLGGPAYLDDRPSPWRWLWRGALIAALAVAAGFGYREYRDYIPTVGVAATYQSTALGLRARVGHGWQRMTRHGHVETRDGAALTSEMFQRGGTTSAPGEVLQLVRVVGPRRSPSSLPLPASVDDWLRSIEARGLPLTPGWWQCDPRAIGHDPTARGCVIELACGRSLDVRPSGGACEGTAYRDGVGYDIRAWFWRVRDGSLAILIWAPRSGDARPRSEAIAIARSIDTL
jgi:hypothetical protein